MTLAILANHTHISEREVAHTWPDGRKDDSQWEDCTFDSGVEYARLTIDPGIPATHREAEALRAASGKGPLGGSNIGDLRAGIKARYGKAPGPTSTSFSELWADLTPGTAAVSQGSMGAFASGHSLRRHDPGFAGAHAVLVIRPFGGADRVWWCDPLAPKGKYEGEWVEKADLRLYVRGLNGAQHISRAIIRPTSVIVTPTPEPASTPVKPVFYTQDDLDEAVDVAVEAAVYAERRRIIALIG